MREAPSRCQVAAMTRRAGPVKGARAAETTRGRGEGPRVSYPPRTRYCARPPFAEERIEELKDGRVAYLMKTPRSGRTHRVMSPVEFLARLAILIPPPFFPLVRYHGVFAARSSWRALVSASSGQSSCDARSASML